MANTQTKPAAPAKAAPAKAAPAQTPQAPAATTYAMGPWPAKHASGNSIRCYMYKVAQQLTAQHKGGFTQAQYANALCNGLAAWAQSGGKVPNTGFGIPASGSNPAKPNGAAKAHAAWPCRPAQGYLVPVAK